MKKRFILKLDIPQPCHEDWDKMTPNERGRHCASCNKTVIDFSDYTDRQLVEFFSKLSGSICGRLTTLQMARPIEYTEPSRFPFLHKLMFGTAMTLGLAGSANGNYNPNNTPLIEQQSTQQKTNQAQPPKTPHHSNPHHYIEGIVLDAKSNTPLADVRLAFLYKGKIIGETKSDSNGHYKFHINGLLRGKEITIVRTYIYRNYDDFSQTITLDTLPYHYDIYLSTRKQVVDVVAIRQPLIRGGCIVGQTITKEDYVRKPVKKQEPFNIDLDNPDRITIHKGDTPYW